ncbi:helix-turn-helix domain-containing protein [Kribbella sp. DT2]|uniref:helix-turn-helix domain-containing protein n=1 Tax=Kribbella sp. DT2 TaxID=3393427 RepID=UPI003CF1309A
MKPEELDALIAGNVRAARARLRLRQEDLADEIGWSRPTVSSLEGGTRRITVADAVALCGALKLTLPELLRGAPSEVFEALGVTPA